MKRYFIMAGILLASLCLISPVMAEEEAAQTLTGTVSVEKNDDDAVVKATVTVGEETVYNVVLDENGKKVAALDGKTVEVTGTVAKKEIEVKDDEGETEKVTELWLTVKSVKEVEEKKEAETDSDE
jgi:archaellum component FlaF (FlaF/FlaG flagellin family)